MKYSVVTTFSPRGYEVYGRRMLRTFTQWWPDDVDLYVFYEGERPSDATDRAMWISLDKDQDRAEFIRTHNEPKQERVSNWQDYYTQCVVTYCHKVFAMTSVPVEKGRLFWIDGDTETIDFVTHDYLASLLPVGYICSFLDRPYKHTETGFLGFNLNEKWGRNFLRDLRRVYTSDDIMKLPEKHDCAAFDYVRAMYEEAAFKFYNLCPGAKGLDVFSQSPLHKVFRHNKGPRGKTQAYNHPMGVPV